LQRMRRWGELWRRRHQRRPDRRADGSWIMRGEYLPLHPLRIPSGWTLRHNNFVDAPFEHSWWDYSGVLLLAYHAEWDLLIDLSWLSGVPWKPNADAGCLLLRVMSGDRTGCELHRFESRDPAAVVTELE